MLLGLGKDLMLMGMEGREGPTINLGFWLVELDGWGEIGAGGHEAQA